MGENLKRLYRKRNTRRSSIHPSDLTDNWRKLHFQRALFFAYFAIPPARLPLLIPWTEIRHLNAIISWRRPDSFARNINPNGSCMSLNCAIGLILSFMIHLCKIAKELAMNRFGVTPNSQPGKWDIIHTVLVFQTIVRWINFYFFVFYRYHRPKPIPDSSLPSNSNIS